MIETPLPPMVPGVLGAQSSGGYSVTGLDTVLMVWDTIQLGIKGRRFALGWIQCCWRTWPAPTVAPPLPWFYFAGLLVDTSWWWKNASNLENQSQNSELFMVGYIVEPCSASVRDVGAGSITPPSPCPPLPYTED